MFQPDTAVVAKCGRVFDHLVASGADIKPIMYNLYMKVTYHGLLAVVCRRSPMKVWYTGRAYGKLSCHTVFDVAIVPPCIDLVITTCQALILLSLIHI